jgi:hypothetical protein
MTVFPASPLSLVSASATGMLASSFFTPQVDPKYISWITGLGSISYSAYRDLKDLENDSIMKGCKKLGLEQSMYNARSSHVTDGEG